MGIKLGKRRRTKNDRSFFLGYKRGGSTDNEIINAGKKWDALGIVDDKFIISYVGAITNNKLDIGAVISAAKQLANMYPDIIFVICGEGDQKDHFESISSKNILYPGWVNNLEIQSLMKRSSLGLVPIKNRFDFIMSIPNKPIEYLSFGVPVITSLRGELSKLIDYYNIGRVYTNEIDVLSNLLLELKSKPMLLNEMSVNAKNLFEKKFKAETVFKDFSKYLENYSNDKEL